jgi:uncharacterized protein
LLFYVQMRWNYQGRISQDQLWDLEALEGEHGVAGIPSGFVQLCKVVSQHRIIAIVKADSLDDLDRNSMGWLPMREFIDFEEVWALRDYEGFLVDVKAKFPPPDAAPRPAPPTLMPDPAQTREIAEGWFGNLQRGRFDEALKLVDPDVIWDNIPPTSGVSDTAPLRSCMSMRNVLQTATSMTCTWPPRCASDTEKSSNGGSSGTHRRSSAPTETCEMVGAMSDSGRANPNAPDPTSTLTPLMLAAGSGKTDLVRELIDTGALINAIDGRAGASALHKACQGGHLHCVRLLVEKGAWIDLQAATTGHTAVVEAIWFKSDEIVAYLLEHDARIELKTYYGFTIDDHISYALRVSHGVADQQKLKRIQDLVAQRRVRDAKRKDAAVPVRAALANDLTAPRQALAGGAAIEQRYPVIGSFEDGHTALLVAARDGRVDLVRELIAAGADVNKVEPVFGAVPLHKATYNGYQEITKLLTMAAGINLDYQGTSNGYTPLLDALWHGFADCAENLLDAGARTDIIGYDGKRALDLAIEKLGPPHPLVARLKATNRSRPAY